jgi:pilus assembly protein CpaE
MDPNRSGGVGQVALFTVNLDQETTDQVSQAAADMPWAIVPVQFHNYFSTANRPHLTQQAISAHACIAIIDLDKDPERALQTSEFLRRGFFHKIAIVAVSSSNDPDLLLRAMRSGFSEFLCNPFDEEELSGLLRRLDRRWSETVTELQNTGKILSFFGAKGGVGTTTLAVHLAMFLVTACKKRVLIIDNHKQLGHVCLYLGLEGSQHYFNELVRNVARLDQDLLRGFIATHSSGLDVLSSPDVHGTVQDTSTESVERTLEFLRTLYDFVILDCEVSFDDTNLAVVDLSSLVYLIATPEIGAIRDLSRYVDGLIQNEHVTEKLQLIINRYSSREAVTIEQIEKAVRLQIAIKIPNNYGELQQAINIGEPVSTTSTSEFATQLMKWAVKLSGNPEVPTRTASKKRFSLWN